MKKISILLVTILCSVLCLSKVSAKDKVKVYVFEAGGCPYCEKEINYLEGLDSYNKEFEIVTKELYVDHVDWEKGKDYDLGVKVANAFKKKGFEDASYQSTPFVVIGNIYAEASYNEELESVIEKAYDKNSPDIVKCFMDKKKNCEDKIAKKDNSSTLTLLVTTAALVGVIFGLIKVRKSNK